MDSLWKGQKRADLYVDNWKIRRLDVMMRGWRYECENHLFLRKSVEVKRTITLGWNQIKLLCYCYFSNESRTIRADGCFKLGPGASPGAPFCF